MNNQKIKSLLALLLIVLVSFFPLVSVKATEDMQNIRVGFFEFEGYHDIDKQGNLSGYGYDYLHEMAKSTNWKYTYFFGTWEENLEMLRNGEIDLLTSAHWTEEREQEFAFSSLPIGEGYVRLSVKSDNSRFVKNDYENFEGIRVGFIEGSTRNITFKTFAEEKGFSYIAIMFSEVDDLSQALHNGTIDAVFTSSQRNLFNERVIAQFRPSVFYCIVLKGNTELLSQVNTAIEDINIKNPTFEAFLYEKYYQSNVSTGISLTKEEMAYIEQNPVLRVAGSLKGFPYFYYSDNEIKGIAVDVLKLITDDIGVKFEIVQSKNQQEAIQMVSNGEADVVALFSADFNWAEKNNIKITSPYMSLNYSMVTHSPFDGEFKRIAVVRGSPIKEDYLRGAYENIEIVSVDTETEAISAVMEKDVDVALVNTYSAQAILYPNFPNLKATTINIKGEDISLGVRKNMSPIMYGILDRGISTLDSYVVSQVIAEYTIFQEQNLTIVQYIKLYPIILVWMLVGIVVLTVFWGFTSKRYASKVFNLAYCDTLTKLWNLNGFELQSKKKIGREEIKCAIITLDIEGFSIINNDYGRKIGDIVIIEIAKHLKNSCEENTIIARSHADNYLIFIEYKKEAEFKITLSDICSLSEINLQNKIVLNIKMHIGVCQLENMNIKSFYSTLEHSQKALQVAKKQMINLVYFDDDLNTRVQREKSIIGGFANALKSDNDLEVYYQPKTDMRNGTIIGAEALIRWNHKELGFLSPVEFIPLLEKTGDVVEVDFFVFEQVCIMIKNWLDTSQAIIPISVNQSRIHFNRVGYIDRLQKLLTKYDIPDKVIEVEITENLFQDQNLVKEMIDKIRSLGLCVSLDDFGSGYSSLSLLNQVSIDTLKIDKSLIDDLESSVKTHKVLKKIVEIAYSIGLEIICEGVEKEEQVDILLEMGCKYAQGYFYSRPVCKKDFIELLK